MWWHTRRNQISSFGETDESISIGGGVSSVDYCAAEVCASVVAMLDIPCFQVVWRVLATHSIRQFPLHFPSRASPCAFTFQLDCVYWIGGWVEAKVNLVIVEKREISYPSRNVPRFIARSACSLSLNWLICSDPTLHRQGYDERKTVTSCRICLLYFLVFLLHSFDWILLMSMWGFGRRLSWRVWKAELDNCLKRHRRSGKIITEFHRFQDLVLQEYKAGAWLFPKLIEEVNLSGLYRRVASWRKPSKYQRDRKRNAGLKKTKILFGTRICALTLRHFHGIGWTNATRLLDSW